jgi:hypothetical protein
VRGISILTFCALIGAAAYVACGWLGLAAAVVFCAGFGAAVDREVL